MSDEDEEHVFLEPSAPIKEEVEETDVNDPRLRRLRTARETMVEQRHPGKGLWSMLSTRVGGSAGATGAQVPFEM